MGTKIKLILIFSIITHGLFAQSNKVNFLKKYAFDKCIQYNYTKIESMFFFNYRDVSGVRFSRLGNFENEKLEDLIIHYTISRTKNFYSMRFESGDKNTIICDCLDFYKSKQLDDYVKKILDIKPKKSIKKKK